MSGSVGVPDVCLVEKTGIQCGDLYGDFPSVFTGGTDDPSVLSPDHVCTVYAIFDACPAGNRQILGKGKDGPVYIGRVSDDPYQFLLQYRRNGGTCAVWLVSEPGEIIGGKGDTFLCADGSGGDLRRCPAGADGLCTASEKRQFPKREPYRFVDAGPVSGQVPV